MLDQDIEVPSPSRADLYLGGKSSHRPCRRTSRRRPLYYFFEGCPSLTAISTQGLEKRYRGGIHALRGVDLQVDREIFGLIGPNARERAPWSKSC